MRAPHLYIIQADVTGAIKIGRTKDPKARLSQLQTGCPYKLRILLVLENQGHLERSLHRKLAYHKVQTVRTRGEWFAYEALPELPDWIYEQLPIPLMDEWWLQR